MTPTQFSEAKSLITEYGTADAERINTRLSWGPARLADWLNQHVPAADAWEPNDPALAALCREGIHAKFVT